MQTSKEITQQRKVGGGKKFGKSHEFLNKIKIFGIFFQHRRIANERSTQIGLKSFSVLTFHFLVLISLCTFWYDIIKILEFLLLLMKRKSTMWWRRMSTVKSSQHRQWLSFTHCYVVMIPAIAVLLTREKLLLSIIHTFFFISLKLERWVEKNLSFSFMKIMKKFQLSRRWEEEWKN